MAKVSVSIYGKSLITALLFVGITSACSRNGAPPNAGKPQAIPVQLQQVEAGTIEESSEFNGTLEAAQRVELKPEIEGRITQIFVKAGTPVAKGTPIVQLRPEKSEAEVGGALANVNAARASLNNAQAELKAAEAERARAQADLKLKEQNLQRNAPLVAQGALPKTNLDQLTSERDAARATLNATEEQIRAARATIDQENSALNQAQSTVAVRTEELKDTRVVAPIAGVVGDIPVKLGGYVKAGDTLTSIIQNNTLELRLSVPVERSSQLRVGLPVQLRSGKGDEIIGTGQISFVSPQVDNQSQAILAKASFPNPEGSLRDGQFVRSRVIWERKSGVSIPTTAITRMAGKEFVYVAQQQGQSQLIARQKPVKLGEIQGNRYNVVDGLKPGEKVVTSGLQSLADGAPIKPES